MFVWLNFVLRDLLIKKYGDHTWTEVCLHIGIPSSTTFPRYELFSDESTITLIEAASKVLKVEKDEMLERFGEYYMVFLREDGYDNLLRCLGDSLQEWLSNINNLHAHLKHVFPEFKSNVSPQIWSKEDLSGEKGLENLGEGRQGGMGGIFLYYQSTRGPLFASMIVGMIREVSRAYFATTVTFERLLTQGVDGSKFNSWRIVGNKPLNTLLPKAARAAFTSHAVSMSQIEGENKNISIFPSIPETDGFGGHGHGHGHVHKADVEIDHMHSSSTPVTNLSSFHAKFRRSTSSPTLINPSNPPSSSSPFLGNRQMKELFPFCIVFDQSMRIIDCGDGLVEVLWRSPVGLSLAESVKIHMPAGDIDTWANFLQLYSVSNSFASEIRSEDGMVLQLSGHISISDDYRTGFYMCHANVQSVEEMKQSRVCPRHLDAHPCHMKLILQTVYLASENRASLKLVHAQKELEKQTALGAQLRRDLIKQAANHATQSLENKRTFARYIGHEIRTPLTVVKLGLRLALKDARQLGASEDFVNNISDCEDSVEVAIAILNDLLSYEKLDSGILEMFKSIIVVVPFIVRSLRPFQKEAQKKNITFKVENNCQFQHNKLVIYGDKSKMSQVIRNFVSNSLKFTPENGTVIVRLSLLKPETKRRSNSDQHNRKRQATSLSPGRKKSNALGAAPNREERRFMRCTSADSLFSMSGGKPRAANTIKNTFDNAEFELLEEVLVVEFIDSGIGISEANQKKLFRDNVQFNPHVTQEGGGAGLGLWISNGIIKLHDGYVDVRSNPDGQPGTTFSMELPIYRKSAQILQRCGSGVNHNDTLYSTTSDFPSSFSEEEQEDDDEEFSEEEEVRFSTNTLSDLRLDLDDQIDEKNVLAALLSDKEKRLARHEEQHQLQQHKNQQERGEIVTVTDSTHHVSPSLELTQRTSRPAELGPLYGCRVLIIDDSKLILRVTSKTLLSLGVVCDTALDGKIGVDKITQMCSKTLPLDSSDKTTESLPNGSDGDGDEKWRTRSNSVDNTFPTLAWDNDYYDLVMLDKQMPVMDGLQTCRQLRQLGYRGTIIGVTGSCMPSEVEEFRKVGIDEVFAKPLDIEQLESFYSRIKEEKN